LVLMRDKPAQQQAPALPQPVASSPVALPAPKLPDPVPPPPAPPTTHSIAIKSEPPQADVMRGDERLGSTPLVIDLKAGVEVVELVLKKRGFAPQTVRVVPDRDREYLLDLQTMKAPPSRKPRQTKAAPAPAPPAEDKSKVRDLKNPF
jgi:hypothetical protein